MFHIDKYLIINIKQKQIGPLFTPVEPSSLLHRISARAEFDQWHFTINYDKFWKKKQEAHSQHFTVNFGIKTKKHIHDS